MEKLEKSFEVSAPVRAAYNQWTQFELFPRIMRGVEEVVQLDDTHLHWRVSVAGHHTEWDAEILEQIPDRLIAWRSISGVPHAGEVRFEPLANDRTRVRLAMQYEPQTAIEKAGIAIGILSRKFDRVVREFKQYLEERGRETGGWRGEVHQGRAVGTKAEAFDTSALDRYRPGGMDNPPRVPERVGRSALD